MRKRVRVIAEIGENHIGDWDMARRMIVAAAEAGADIVKLQSYLGTEVSPNDPEREWFTKVHVPDELHFELKTLVEQHGVEFLTTPFSLERARFVVEKLGLRKIKVASSEMLNAALLEYLNGRVDVVYLSTGMATLDEVRRAVAHLRDVRELYILHCTSEYPCPDAHANVAAVTTLKTAFPSHRIGLSDHTIGITAPAIAVALGAEIIEKHFTLDKSLPGTDHVLSVTPNELKEMIELIRTVELLLGDGAKEPSEAERGIREFVRSRFPKA
jgi:N,N'-diacetyllegionaminate synthase